MDEPITQAPKMPAEIAKAVVAACKRVRTLGKDERNEFAKFNYVSVDKFYEVVGPIMADVGLFVMVDEEDLKIEAKGGDSKSAWLSAEYLLTLYHESGASFGPIRRKMMVQASGPQAFGTGMSYVEKYFIRSLLKVPTGEQDADADPQNGMPDKAAKAEQQKQLRDKHLPVAEGVADQGEAELKKWWSSIATQPIREALKNDLAALKTRAAKAKAGAA